MHREPFPGAGPRTGILLFVVAALAGCGGDDSDPGPTVRIWLDRGERLEAVTRSVETVRPREALDALVAGPTPAERRRGLGSWFGPETADAVRDVHSTGDRLVVDFRSSLPSRIPGASSSAGSAALLGALDSTVFQFPSVDAVEYRLDGSCAAFWEWLQRQCRVVRR